MMEGVNGVRDGVDIIAQLDTCGGLFRHPVRVLSKMIGDANGCHRPANHEMTKCHSNGLYHVFVASVFNNV